MNKIIKEITREQEKKNRNHFKTGDGVRIHQKIIEGEKERIQIFSGIVIAKKGSGIQETFTVRRVISGEGVEKIFPTHSPSIIKIEIDRKSIVMKARMYYMRNRKGKLANKVKEKKFIRKQNRI